MLDAFPSLSLDLTRVKIYPLTVLEVLVESHCLQEWMKTVPKMSSSASGLSPALPPDSGMPSFRCGENLSLLHFSQEAQD